jgi:hypothetical protein
VASQSNNCSVSYVKWSNPIFKEKETKRKENEEEKKGQPGAELCQAHKKLRVSLACFTY